MKFLHAVFCLIFTLGLFNVMASYTPLNSFPPCQRECQLKYLKTSRGCYLPAYKPIPPAECNKPNVEEKEKCMRKCEIQGKLGK